MEEETVRVAGVAFLYLRGGGRLRKVLSIIMPVHNKADTLPRVIDCLLSQDLPAQDSEIIFVADQCTDGSLSILREAESRGSAHLLEITSGGGCAAKARNIGWGASSGMFTLFLDPDIIIPPNFFSTVVSHLHSSRRTVCLAPVYGNASSLSTWPFIVQNHDAWSGMTGEGVLQWLSSQEHLKDLRKRFADEQTGFLEGLLAPWVFCWSSALAAERALIDEVGGFDTNFRYKGSEDLELGYRLHSANARFKLMLDAQVFHIPHRRDRDREEHTDRMHEREMLRLHTTREMEALCAFDGAHANDLLEALAVVEARASDEMCRAWESPVSLRNLKLPTALQLLVGFSPAWLVSALQPSYIVNPFTQCTDRELPLFGFALPFEDQSFRRAALIGTWQLFPERLASRIIDEVLRVAEEVYLLKIKYPPVPLSLLLNKIMEVNDAPYWERTHPVRRSFFDFNLVPLGEDSPVYSYKVGRSARGFVQ